MKLCHQVSILSRVPEYELWLSKGEWREKMNHSIVSPISAIFVSAYKHGSQIRLTLELLLEAILHVQLNVEVFSKPLECK